MNKILLRNISISLRNQNLNTWLNNTAVFRAIKYIQDVEKQQELLQKTPVEQKVVVLCERIQEYPYIIRTLDRFHLECRKIGINHHSPETRKAGLKYWFTYIFKLLPLSNSFWSQCDAFDISNNHHRLNMNIKYLGILDPIHYKDPTKNDLK